MYLQSKKAQSQLAKSHITLEPSSNQVIVNSVSGKRERVFVSLEAIYPSPEEPGSELSFEEVWAMTRGWLEQSWDDGPVSDMENLGHMVAEKLVVHTETVTLDENGAIKKKDGKPKKKKFMEVNETQISRFSDDWRGSPVLTTCSQGKPGRGAQAQDEEEERDGRADHDAAYQSSNR